MTLPSFTDLGLAAVVLVLAIVPAALLVLAVIGILQSTRLDSRLESWLGPAVCRVAGVLGATLALAVFLRLSWDWSAATHLKPLCAALAEPWFSGIPPAGPAGAGLKVQRRTVETGYWTTITADRYSAVDEVTGQVLAEADELWIDAGSTRYRCGVASGPLPVRQRAAPAKDGIDGFLARASRGSP